MIDPADRKRVVVGGTQGGNMTRNSALGKPTSSEEVEQDVLALIERMLAANANIRALLFTCTGFPVITPAIRARFGLPIYDISTCGRLAIESAVSAGLVHAPRAPSARAGAQKGAVIA